MRPIGIDLFAGAGGLSLGFEQAGFDIAAAVEIDPVHCAVHKFNFPRTAIVPRSVEGLSGAAIVEAAGIGYRPVDCVFGGAPCQGFSLIGHRILDDPRNRLVREFVRLVAELGARTFVFENVKGLTVGRHRAFLDELVTEFSDAGYDVRIPWRVLNAGHFGTPQHRERLILLGARKGERLPDYPDPTTNIAGGRNRIDDLPDGPTCADALGDLPDAERFGVLVDCDAVKTSAFGEPSTYATALRCLTNDAWHSGYAREWNPAVLTSSARTKHTAISRRRFCGTKPGSVEPISRFFKLCATGVSNTLRAGTDGARGAFTSPRPIHYRYDRCITVREMARLHGFPDWFRFNATKWHGARQIGNAVPPPLGRAIAGSVIEALGIVPTRTSRAIALGDAALLSLDLSGAAAQFGVDAPPSRRDRKSGATKRKQIDIERERLSGQPAYA
ncbi:MAG: DNA cytosine methyltransferase [Rhodospirillaceae bacterium]|nr:DNA cytosine methyltransferase [Rhodospirillaceae bacterium]